MLSSGNLNSLVKNEISKRLTTPNVAALSMANREWNKFAKERMTKNKIKAARFTLERYAAESDPLKREEYWNKIYRNYHDVLHEAVGMQSLQDAQGTIKPFKDLIAQIYNTYYILVKRNTNTNRNRNVALSNTLLLIKNTGPDIIALYNFAIKKSILKVSLLLRDLLDDVEECILSNYNYSKEDLEFVENVMLGFPEVVIVLYELVPPKPSDRNDPIYHSIFYMKKQYNEIAIICEGELFNVNPVLVTKIRQHRQSFQQQLNGGCRQSRRARKTCKNLPKTSAEKKNTQAVTRSRSSSSQRKSL